MNNKIRIILILVITLFALNQQYQPAQAGTLIVVTTGNDTNINSPSDGLCSLREAIIAANNNVKTDVCAAGSASSTDFISFHSSVTTAVLTHIPPGGGDPTYGDLDVTQSLHIMGHPDKKTTIIAGDTFSDRFLEVSGKATLTLTNLILRKAKNRFDGNGGAIFVSNGTLNLEKTDLIENMGSYGGAVFVSAVSVLNMNESRVENNTASNGGGIMNQGTLRVMNSYFLANNATSNGGAIEANSGTGTTEIVNSTFYMNKAIQGAAIVGTSEVILKNSTVISNITSGGSNTAALYFGSGGYMQNSIILQRSNLSKTCQIPSSSFKSRGGNIEDGNTCLDSLHPLGESDKFGVTGDVVSAAPALNGGHTHSFMPVDGSLALGIGTDCPANDQRGPFSGRPFAPSKCDAGSVEKNAVKKLNNLYLPSVFVK